MTRNQRQHSRQRGIAYFWAAATTLLAVAVIGLSVDTAHVILTSQQLQIGADAAALAGAHKVRLNIADARTASINTALANTAANDAILLAFNDTNAVAGDIVVGVYDRSTSTFTPTTTGAHAVKVVARRTTTSLGGQLGLLFGPIFGIDQVDVARYAIAKLKGGIGAGVIALNPTAKCAFDLRGTAGSFIVNDGAIYVDSDNANAACHAGKPSLVAEELYVTGDTDKNYESKVDYDGDLYTGADPIPDPLADLPEPTYNVANDLGTVWVDGGETVNVTPGYYSGGFTIRNGTLNVAPGIYILGGAGLDDNGGNLYAEGVMFYIVDTGYVDLRGNGQIVLSPPDTNQYTYPASPDVTPYAEAGVTIFLARGNTNDSRILGTNQFNGSGTYYFPDAHIEIGGTSQSFANGLIADTIEAHGDGELIINYDDRFPRIPRSVYLVE